MERRESNILPTNLSNHRRTESRQTTSRPTSSLSLGRAPSISSGSNPHTTIQPKTPGIKNNGFGPSDFDNVINPLQILISMFVVDVYLFICVFFNRWCKVLLKLRVQKV